MLEAGACLLAAFAWVQVPRDERQACCRLASTSDLAVHEQLHSWEQLRAYLLRAHVCCC
jgi:hypothetical protein